MDHKCYVCHEPCDCRLPTDCAGCSECDAEFDGDDDPYEPFGGDDEEDDEDYGDEF